MSFDINGIAHGIEKGLQYQVDFFKHVVDAVKRNDVAELDALTAVANTFIHEAVDTSGLVKKNIAALMLVGDPFSGSRKQMQDVAVKFPIKK